MIRLGALATLALVACTACGGSSGGVPTIQPAKTYALVGFEPSAPATAGTPTTVSFKIRQPDGTTMTRFKRGAGPHTGVHLIIVRDDLAGIIHLHPPIDADGTIHAQVTFTEAGPYRVVVDAYPDTTGPQQNFQLFDKLTVAGAYTPQKLPAFARTVYEGGYGFTIKGKPDLKALEASLITIDVADPLGGPTTFTPWFGALAHAIFFRAGSLDYFHTHVCAPGATGCTSSIGGTQVTGTSTASGQLKVGVLVPAPGTWRLFLQCEVNGHVLTVPFTLVVS